MTGRSASAGIAAVWAVAALAAASILVPRLGRSSSAHLVSTRADSEGHAPVGADNIVLDLSTGRERPIAHGLAPCLPTPITNPDRGLIAYCGRGEVVIVDVPGGSQEQIDLRPGDFPLGWRPDGGLIAVRQHQVSALLELHGGRLEVIHQAHGYLYPPLVWISRDRFTMTRCAVEDCSDGGESIFVDLSGANGESIQHRDRVVPLLGLPGDRLLHLEESGDFSRLAIQHWTDRGLLAEWTGQAFSGGAAANGHGTVALVGQTDVGGQTGIYALDKTRRLRRLTDSDGGTITWLPGRKGIAYELDDEIRIVDLDGRSRVVARDKRIRLITVL